MNWVDWAVIGVFMAVMMGVGLTFTRRASANLQSYFVSGRSLPWYIAGGSLIATSFAADTPLWVTSLVRQYGVYYIWQYWAPFIGAALAVALFARLWRRMGVMTDIEFLEKRYSGKTAGVLRFWEGASLSLFFCPLIIGWVAKAMETITREAMGLPEESRVWSTAAVVAMALVLCALSGLWGVVYTDFLQFLIATIGTIILAIMAVWHVGGLDALVDQLANNEHIKENVTKIVPSIGPGEDQMSVWNAIGYFGILWWMVAASGGYQAQRLLACKDSKHSSYAMLMHTIFYYGIVCWPWIIVALCSLVILPELGEGVSQDSAYPRMIVTILPMGMRGLLIAALLAAFISTISTMFNWGSSYLIHDVYKRFLVRSAPSSHYIWMSRLATIYMAAVGGIISFQADNIQQLLSIAFVIGAGRTVVSLLRWFWWRLNAAGDLAAVVSSWSLAGILVFTDLFDRPARLILGLSKEVHFSSDDDLMGARMLFMVVSVTVVAIFVTFLTKPTADFRLKEFLLKVQPFHFFWKPVINRLQIEYPERDNLRRTLISWLIMVICVVALIGGIGEILLGSLLKGLIALILFLLTLGLTIKRVKEDFSTDVSEVAMKENHNS